MRMIDGDALEENVKRACCTNCDNYGGVRCRACPADDALTMIEDAPTLGSDCENCGKVKTCKHVLGHPATITRINCPLWRPKK